MLRRPAVLVTLVAALLLIATSCTLAPTALAPTPSPEVSPTTAATSPSATPVESPSPPLETSPSPPASPSPSKLIITSVPFHIGEVGLTYGTVTLGAAGGVKPYKWSISSGALPPGLALSTGGKVTGTPTAVGTFSLVARVDDSAGAAAGVTRSILVFRQIGFVTKYALCASGYSTACTVTLRYSGGRGGVVTAHITAIAPVPCSPAGFCPQPPPPGKPPYTPPSGFKASGSGGTLTVSEPTNCNGTCGSTGGYWRLTLRITDSSACTAGYRCTSSNTAIVDVEMLGAG